MDGDQPIRVNPQGDPRGSGVVGRGPGVDRPGVCLACGGDVTLTEFPTIDMHYRGSVSCRACGWSEGFAIPMMVLRASTGARSVILDSLRYIVQSAVIKHSAPPRATISEVQPTHLLEKPSD